ncbi:MAG: hypothetical protein COB66_01735 [Coxiella sp. (in: Bacteria)]|nr:MAG: hypothetical protein COB66_01735 [Coxiella sp. (in: g-proteobacteria)]
MLKDWWHEREQREQYILIGGGIIAAILLVYMLIWRPLSIHIADQQQNVTQNQALLTWMTTADTRLAQLKAMGYIKKTNASQAMLVTIEQSLVSSKLSPYVSNTQQQNTQQIQLTLKQVPFDKFIDWAEALWKSDNIVVKTAAIKKGAVTGTADVTLTLMQ